MLAPPRVTLPVLEAAEKFSLVEISRLVDETFPRVFCPALDWNEPPTVTLPVVETLAIVVEVLRVSTPVEETNVMRRDDDAPPPRVPNKSWESIPRDKKVSDEVEYLLPFTSTRTLPTCRLLEIEMLVLETFVIEEDPIERTPVEVEMVKSADDVALPPSCPKRICESTPRERKVSDEVEYLFPLKSTRLVRTASVPIVDEATYS